MSRSALACTALLGLALGLSLPLAGSGTASAETLRCRSVNGNVTCAGPGASSCQTVNGKTVCTSGRGDVVQSFGNGHAAGDQAGLGDDADAEELDAVPDEAPGGKLRLEQRDARGRTLHLERDGTRLHLRTDWLSVDRD